VRNPLPTPAWLNSWAWAGSAGIRFKLVGGEARRAVRSPGPGPKTTAATWPIRSDQRASPAARPNGLLLAFLRGAPTAALLVLDLRPRPASTAQMPSTFYGILFVPAPQRGWTCPASIPELGWCAGPAMACSAFNRRLCCSGRPITPFSPLPAGACLRPGSFRTPSPRQPIAPDERKPPPSWSCCSCRFCSGALLGLALLKPSPSAGLLGSFAGAPSSPSLAMPWPLVVAGHHYSAFLLGSIPPWC